MLIFVHVRHIRIGVSVRSSRMSHHSRARSLLSSQGQGGGNGGAHDTLTPAANVVLAEVSLRRLGVGDGVPRTLPGHCLRGDARERVNLACQFRPRGHMDS